jgi:group I intron endonuclease
MIGIYCITNNINGKRYIGQSTDIAFRWSRHKAMYTKNHLTNAIGKYGVSSFSFDVLREVSESPLTKILLDVFETAYIKKYNTMDPRYGYNKISGGSSGRVPSQETIEKISRNRKGKGSRPMSEEHKLKISKTRVGKKRPRFSADWIEHLRLSSTGKKHSQATKDKIAKANKGKVFTEEHKRHMKEAQAKRLGGY